MEEEQDVFSYMWDSLFKEEVVGPVKTHAATIPSSEPRVVTQQNTDSQGSVPSIQELEDAYPLQGEDLEVFELVKAHVPKELLDFSTEEMVKRFIRGDRNKVPRVEKTVMRFNEVLAWRRDNNIDTLLSRSLRNTEAFHRGWPVWVGGEDKYGRLTMLERIDHLDVEVLASQFTLPELVMHRSQVMEQIDMLKKKVQARRGYPVYKIHSIIDVQGLSLDHISRTEVREAIQTIIKTSSNYYTDTLFRCYVINAPFVFRMVWGIISPFIDPETLLKIQILGSASSYLPAMESAGLPLESIPKAIGGRYEEESVASHLAKVGAQRGAGNDMDADKFADADQSIAPPPTAARVQLTGGRKPSLLRNVSKSFDELTLDRIDSTTSNEESFQRLKDQSANDILLGMLLLASILLAYLAAQEWI